MIKMINMCFKYLINKYNKVKNILSKRYVRVSLLLVVVFIFVYEEQRSDFKLKSDFLQISPSCNLSYLMNNYDIETTHKYDYVNLISLYNKKYMKNLELLKENNSETCLLDIYNGYLRLIEDKINKCYEAYGAKCSLKKVDLIPIENFLKIPNFSIYKINYYTKLKLKYNKIKESND
jgi:hypothetical protein